VHDRLRVDHHLDVVVAGAPNSSWASMTSRPLFMSVDESTVIFGPMLHVGWARASVDGDVGQVAGGCGPGTGRPRR
jgi:hypothetical protein